MLRTIGKANSAAPDGTLARLGKPPTGIWLETALDLAEQFSASLGPELLSVALRGSTARGAAVMNSSDIDIIAILRESTCDHSDQDLEFNSAIQPDLDVEASVLSIDQLLNSPSQEWLRFSLSYSGWTIWGKDFITGLAQPRLGPHCYGHLPRFEKWIASYNAYSKENDKHENRDVCQWVMKRIVRSLFESVMMKERAYSRDIYPCALAAARHYHDHAPDIWACAEFAVCPTDELLIVDNLVERMTPLLAKAKQNIDLT